MTNDLKERLARVETAGRLGSEICTNWHRNPDGPEALARILELEGEVERLTELMTERMTDAVQHAIELEGALAPFAAVGEAIDSNSFGEALFRSDAVAFECQWTVDGVEKTLTWGDFRKALSLHGKVK